MKTTLPAVLFLLLYGFLAQLQAQQPVARDQIVDTSNPQPSGLKNPPPITLLGLTPLFQFDEFPINHNMHIACDGTYYYTINGGNFSTGQINQFDLAGVLIQTYPIQIDGRGLSYNAADSSLYASLYAGDIVRIDSLPGGTFTTLFTATMHNAQASFAISPDGTEFYDFYAGTLYIHDFNTGIVKDTLFGLAYGAGNFGGEEAVAVDSNFIYTWDATIQTVSVYDKLGVFQQTMVLDSGSNGHSLSVTNGKLFVSRDGNYAIGTWYGYQLDSVPAGFAPVAGFTSTDTTFCEKQEINFLDASTNSPTSWQWLFPGASPSTSTDQNPDSIYYGSYGSFDVTLIACNVFGCDTIYIPAFIQEFQSPPAPVVTAYNDTLVSSPAFAYQWYFNSSPISGATDSLCVMQQPGTYYVIVTDSNGCASSSVTFTTGIHDPNNHSSDILVLPNPSDGNFSLYDIPAHATLRIYDISGRIYYDVKTLSPSLDLKLNGSDGIYFIEVISDNRTIRKKLVVNSQY